MRTAAEPSCLCCNDPIASADASLTQPTSVRHPLARTHASKQRWPHCTSKRDCGACRSSHLSLKSTAPSRGPSALRGVNQRGQGCPESKLGRKPLREGGSQCKAMRGRKGGRAYLSRWASISSSKWINSAFRSGVLLENGCFCLKMGCVILPH